MKNLNTTARATALSFLLIFSASASWAQSRAGASINCQLKTGGQAGAADQKWTVQDFMQKRHAELRLWPMFMKGTPKAQTGTPEAAEMSRQHFLYWWDLEEQGKLLGAGPMDAGTPEAAGFVILIAATREEAEKLAHNEPFHKAGWRVNTVHTWSLNEGVAVPLVKAMTGAKKEYVTSALRCDSDAK
jgi:uncharacterized protein YciI